VRACKSGPLGPLMRAQQAGGAIPSNINEEDVVIIRATAPPAADVCAQQPRVS
jgi:release factor glutamine methyltransferase